MRYGRLSWRSNVMPDDLKNDNTCDLGPTARIRRSLVNIIFAFFAFYWAALTGSLIIVYIWPRPRTWLLTTLVNQHFAAIVGLPTTCLMCFCIVWLLRASEGDLSIEVLGFKLRGAAGPIFLWIAAFLAMAFATWLLWPLSN